MNLTIIETGQVPEPLREDWPDYPAMFEALLSPHLPGWTYSAIALSRGAGLPNPADLDAILITGSPAGVYEPLPWMQPLFQFIRDATDAKTPQIGICFGHQAIAHALGADVGKSDKGWGIGRHAYELVARPDWIEGNDPGFSLGVSHQDQVRSLPPGAARIASSPFTPFAAIDYPDAPAISFQGHPEFSPEFSCALYNIRKGAALAEQLVETAEQSLTTPIDNDLVGQWMAGFLKRSLASATTPLL